MLKVVNFYIKFILNAFTRLKPEEKTGFTPFAFSPDTKNSPGTFELVFFLDDIKHEYYLSLDKKSVHEEKLFYSPKGQKKLIYQRVCKNCDADGDKLDYDWKWGDSLLGSKKKIADMTRPNTSFLNTAAQLEHEDLGKIYKAIDSSFMPKITPGTEGLLGFTMSWLEKDASVKKEILRFLSKADFGNIQDIKIETKEIPASILNRLPNEMKADIKTKEGKYKMKEIFISHQYDEDYLLPLVKESAGTQRLIELAGPLLELIKKQRFICIDEIETSLHQELLEFFLITFLENSTDSQILFTTHNLDLLDSELLLNDEIWFCEKDATGGSNYTNFVEYKGVRKGSSRKNLYKAGKFGAKPILSSFVVD